MTQPRHVEFKSSVCSLCGGTHYGSTECPYRCERCTTNTDPCHLPDCPRNARWAAENAAADARIAADRGKPLAREQIEHHLRECRMNTQPKHTLPRDRLMALCEAALRSLPTEELSLTAALDKIEASLEAASEERYQELKVWEKEAWKWKAEGDGYGWNFHTGMAAGANWCDIFYRRIGRTIKELRKAIPSPQAQQSDAT